MDGLLGIGSKRLLVAACIVLCLVVTIGTYGNAEESGGEPIPLLRYGTTARIWGMGNAGVACAQGVEGLYYNPAVFGGLRQPELSISHSSAFVDYDLNFLAAALPLTDKAGVGVGLLISSSTGIPRTGHEEGSQKGYFDFLQTAIYVGAGLEISEGCEAGVTMKGLFGQVDDEACRGYSLEGGVRYKVNELLTIGVLARDMVGTLSWTTGTREQIPHQIIGGATISLLDESLLITGQTAMGFKDWGFGAEYSIGDYIRLRGGYVEDSVTAGAGLKAGSITLDYSWVGHALGGAHRVSFGVRF